MPLFLKVMKKTISKRMLTPKLFGKKFFRKSRYCPEIKKTIFGKWAIRGLADRVRKYISIFVRKRRRKRAAVGNWATKITHRCSRVGIWCLCSSTAEPLENWKTCPKNTSIPEWDLNFSA